MSGGRPVSLPGSEPTSGLERLQCVDRGFDVVNTNHVRAGSRDGESHAQGSRTAVGRLVLEYLAEESFS